jgi:hypothetical protein
MHPIQKCGFVFPGTLSIGEKFRDCLKTPEADGSGPGHAHVADFRSRPQSASKPSAQQAHVITSKHQRQRGAHQHYRCPK